MEDAAYTQDQGASSHSRNPAAIKQRLGNIFGHGKDPDSTDVVSVAATAAIVVGAALIEVELIPGLIIGAGAILLGKLFPEMGAYVRPALKGAIRGGFVMAQKAREVIAEATEQVHDLVAEVVLEQQEPKVAGKAPPAPQAVSPAQPAV